MTQKTAKIEDAISEAYGELESLGAEMREVYDNAPDNLKGTEVNQAREAAAETLEGLSEPDVPTSLQDLMISWIEPKMPRKGFSRRARRDNACAILESVIEVLEEKEDDDDAETLRGEVEELKDEADGVEFPGMYG